MVAEAPHRFPFTDSVGLSIEFSATTAADGMTSTRDSIPAAQTDFQVATS